MHIAINAWFWDRPDTGSGQYLRQLVQTFSEITPRLEITLIAPRGMPVDAPQRVAVERVALRGRGHLAKVRFEQQASRRPPGASGRTWPMCRTGAAR